MGIAELAENIGLDLDEFAEIFEIYVETTSSYLEELKTALRDGDTKTAHEKSHSIKGATGNLGLEELYELAREIDDRVREDSMNGVEDMVNTFQEKYEKLVEDFEKG